MTRFIITTAVLAYVCVTSLGWPVNNELNPAASAELEKVQFSNNGFDESGIEAVGHRAYEEDFKVLDPNDPQVIAIAREAMFSIEEGNAFFKDVVVYKAVLQTGNPEIYEFMVTAKRCEDGSCELVGCKLEYLIHRNLDERPLEYICGEVVYT